MVVLLKDCRTGSRLIPAVPENKIVARVWDRCPLIPPRWKRQLDPLILFRLLVNRRDLRDTVRFPRRGRRNKNHIFPS